MIETVEIELEPSTQTNSTSLSKALTTEEITQNNNRTLVSILWRRFRELSADSSVHAYHNIYKTKFVLLRLIWFVLFLVSLGFCAFLVIGTIRAYTSFSVTTTTRVKQPATADGSMTFPVISFCNAKPFMTQAAFDYAIQQFIEIYQDDAPDNITSVLYETFTEPSLLEWFYVDPLMNQIMLTIIQRIADLNQTDIQQTFGLSFEEFFNFYGFASKHNLYDSFNWYWDPLYGNCFRFNTGRAQDGSKIDLISQSESGQATRFHTIHLIDVFPNQSYNFLNLYQTTTLGVRVGIDDQDAIPLNMNMIPVRPGACTYLGLRKTVTTHLPQPYSPCKSGFHSVLYDKFSELNKTYSQRVCMQMCKQMQVIEFLNCSIVHYPNVDNYPTCKSLDEISLWWHDLEFDMNRCADLCPVECVTTSFDFITATELFPDKNYFKIKKADTTMNQLFENANVSLENASYESVANSLACVYIYYQDLQTTFINESQAMNVFDLLGNIGGSLGLCLGISLLSFCEVLEILVELCHLVLNVRILADWKKGHNKKK